MFLQSRPRILTQPPKMPMSKDKAGLDLKLSFGDLEFVPGPEVQNGCTDISKEVTKDPENSANKPPKSSTLQSILFVGKSAKKKK